MGSELQKPLSIAMLGDADRGTAVSYLLFLWFIGLSIETCIMKKDTRGHSSFMRSVRY